MEKYMRRALSLAANGRYDTSPNPMVGAVITAPDGSIIGEGWHRRYGEGHAEVNAVASVTDPSLLRDATMYVTLEPCSHHGKTPPCAELIIRSGIPRVVVGCLDPFERVSGRGVRMLREAGVDVRVGMLEQECRELNRKFITANTLGRPYVTLKWACDPDGMMDGRISTPQTSMLVHRLRAEHDFIAVGSGTWLADNPRLDTRLWGGRSPRRAVFDRRRRLKGLPEDVTVLSAPTLGQSLKQLRDAGAISVLVEGGAELLHSFLREGLWDEIRVERGTVPVGGKVKAPLPEAYGLPDGTDTGIETVDGHRILTYRRRI